MANDGVLHAGVRERVLSQLLAEMDGLQQRAGVIVLGATNRPDKLDAALLRPGRFDRLVHVSAPDAAARASILSVLLRPTPLGTDVSVEALAARTECFTGADLKALVREAAVCALQESFEVAAVMQRHFEAALLQCEASPPVPAALQAAYESLQRQGGRAPSALVVEE